MFMDGTVSTKPLYTEKLFSSISVFCKFIQS